MNTKKEWIEYFKNTTYIKTKYAVENDKNKFVSFFYKNAKDSHKNDRLLNVLHFNKSGFVEEIPTTMIDLEFLKECFKLKHSNNIFNIPYEFKNNQESKSFLKQLLTELKHQSRDYRGSEIMWSFESKFWLDLDFTKGIKKFDYDYLNYAIFYELNSEKDNKYERFIVDEVIKNPYLIKFTKEKIKDLLPQKTVIEYATDYGIKALSKKQKNDFKIIETAFKNKKFFYKDLDIKWKNENYLSILLNNKEIWYSEINSKNLIKLEEINENLFNNKDIVKSILSYGFNLIEFKQLGYDNIFKDKELKILSLKTYCDYKIIEDKLNDRDLIIEFLTNLEEDKLNEINLYEQTKRIDSCLFKDKSVVIQYLKLSGLNQENIFVENFKKVVNEYSLEDLKEFLNINQKIFSFLNSKNQNNYSLLRIYFEKNKFISHHVNKDVKEKVEKLSGDFDEKLKTLKIYELEEKINNSLSDSPKIKSLKI